MPWYIPAAAVIGAAVALFVLIWAVVSLVDRVERLELGMRSVLKHQAAENATLRRRLAVLEEQAGFAARRQNMLDKRVYAEPEIVRPAHSEEEPQ